MRRGIPLKILTALTGVVLAVSSSALAAPALAHGSDSLQAPPGVKVAEANGSESAQTNGAELTDSTGAAPSSVTASDPAAQLVTENQASLSAASGTTSSLSSASGSTISSANRILIGPDIMQIAVENGAIKATLLNQAGNLPELQLGLEIITAEGTVANKFTQSEEAVSAFQAQIDSTPVPENALIRIFAANTSVFLSGDSGNNTKLTVNTYGYYFRVESGQLVSLSNDITPNLLSVKKNATQVQVTGRATANKQINLRLDTTTTSATVSENGEFNLTFKLPRTLTAEDELLLSYGDHVDVKVPLKLLAADPYFFSNNIWNGPAFKLTFDLATNKMVAERQAGHFGNDGEFFRLYLFHTGETSPYYTYVQSNKEIQRAVTELNTKPFTKGDVLAFRLGAPLSGKAYFNSKEQKYSLKANAWVYYTITDEGLEAYDFPLSVDPMPVYRGEKLSTLTLSGTTLANSEVSVAVDQAGAASVTTRSNTEGQFQVELRYDQGIDLNTPIRVAVGQFDKIVYIQRSTAENIRLKTDSGYEYVLNASLDEILKPMGADRLYAYRILSPDAQKAWDIAQNAILNAKEYLPYDKNGNTYIDVMYPNLNLTKEDINAILKYLIRSDPRMFLLKDWSGTPLYQGSKIIGQKFIIGNGVKSPEDFYQRLEKIEVGVSDILQYITPDMDVYQIIKVLETKFESSVKYKFHWNDSDIRGTFIDKYAICGGYSKGIEYLLLRVGIENVWVQGFVSGGGGHAWNLVNIYNSWHLADTTWGGKNWYLMGKESPQFVDARTTTAVYNPMPTLSQYTIPWEAGDLGNNLVNNMGIVNIQEQDNQVTITYDTRKGTVNNNAVAVKTSLDQYQDQAMQQEEGVWTYRFTLTPEMANDKGEVPFDFFFKVEDRYFTAGNIRTNQLQNRLLGNGMNNIIYTAHYVDLAKRELEKQVNALYESAQAELTALTLPALEAQSYQEKLKAAKEEYLQQLASVNAAENTTFIPAVTAGFALITKQAQTSALVEHLRTQHAQAQQELSQLKHESVKTDYTARLAEQNQQFQAQLSLLDNQVKASEITEAFARIVQAAQLADQAETEKEQAEKEQAEKEQAEREQAEREQAEKEQAEKEQDEKDKAEAEKDPAEKEENNSQPSPLPDPSKPDPSKPDPSVPEPNKPGTTNPGTTKPNDKPGNAQAEGNQSNPDSSRPSPGKPDSGQSNTGKACQNLFKDVPASHAFYNSICWFAQQKITTGYADGSFRPEGSVERAAMAAFLYRLAGRPAVTLPQQSPFKDVSAQDPFYKEIIWLAKTGITTGYADGTFRPSLPIERQAMAAFLYRYNAQVSAKPIKATGPKRVFTDVAASGFQQEIDWLARAGISTGWADGSFRPNLPIERQAMAAFIERMQRQSR